MADFQRIREALEYIDTHLDEPISLESLAARFHFSPFYFHRMFSLIVGKTIAVHIRDRRLLAAGRALAQTRKSILEIGLDCGYGSAPAFSRAFRQAFGLPPSEYRRLGLAPDMPPVNEMIMQFTNRLKGGMYLHPKIIRRAALHIAGVAGDGERTAELWSAFERLHAEKPLADRQGENGFEIRTFDGTEHIVHVGYAVPDKTDIPGYTIFTLPAAQYASFEVYVANGYTSENEAMQEWLATNEQGFTERLLGSAHYVVECYDERFNGEETGSIVEIWLPVEKA